MSVWTICTLPLKEGIYDPITEIEYFYQYNFTVDWGDGTVNTVTSFDDINATHEYATTGTYNITIRGLCECFDTWGYD